MYIARAERRAALVVPTVAMTLLLTACGGDAGSGNTEDTTVNGNNTAASAPANATESAATSESTDTSESPEYSNSPPAGQDADGIELTITSAGPSETMSDASAVSFEWTIEPGPTGACDFMVTVYDQAGDILTATPGTACTSELQLDFMGYDVEEFTVELTSGDKTAVRKMAMEG
ncbi:hypothetical protein [Corynebacterium xerosis]|nr:hypothetical protein [Corynebacterium xerosis]